MHIALIYMASGFSRRFGGNKLLAPLAGIPLYRHGFDQLQDAARRISVSLSCSCCLYVVSQYDEILSWCRAHDAIAVKNAAAGEGMAASVRLGVETSAAVDAWAFFAADQPFLSGKTISDFVMQYAQSGCSIGCAVSGCRRGSPAIFSHVYKDELLALQGDKGGRAILEKYKDDLWSFTMPEGELCDIDTRDDWEAAERQLEKKRLD